jgi:hypothetical protein
VHEHLVESALARQIRLIFAKMPLAEKARRIASAPQGFGKRDYSRRKALALPDGVGDAHLELVTPAHERGACGRATRAHMEVGEACALGMQAIEVRRLQIRVPRAGEIAHPLVVGNDKNDIRPTA